MGAVRRRVRIWAASSSSAGVMGGFEVVEGRGSMTGFSMMGLGGRLGSIGSRLLLAPQRQLRRMVCRSIALNLLPGEW